MALAIWPITALVFPEAAGLVTLPELYVYILLTVKPYDRIGLLLLTLPLLGYPV